MQNSVIKAGIGDPDLQQIQWEGKNIDLSLDSARHVCLQNRQHAIDFNAYRGSGKFLHLLVNGRSMRLEHILRTEEGDLLFRLNGVRYSIPIQNRRELLLAKTKGTGPRTNKQTALRAPMPGLVLRVMVTEGQAVRQGDPILVLESMKMENVLRAHSACTVVFMGVRPGEVVEKGQVLVKFS